jgi:beta-galactosidase
VPTAGNMVSFELSGPGRIRGVGDGDPSSHEPDTFVPVSASRSIPVASWRWRKVADPYPESLPELGAAYDDSGWAETDVGADTGSLGLREKAIYRARFAVSAGDLDADAVELVFGRIAGGISVYVNGHKVSGTIDGRTAAIFDVKALLHPGENVIVVPTASYGSDATGLSRGASLRLQAAAPAVHWSRSTFNGLAEVIVQSSKDPGTVTLTASSDGLKPASFQLNAVAADARPALP